MVWAATSLHVPTGSPECEREELADPHSCPAGEGDGRRAASDRVEDQRAEQCTTMQEILDQHTALTRLIRKSPHAFS